jgi:hypothetical protein
MGMTKDQKIHGNPADMNRAELLEVQRVTVLLTALRRLCRGMEDAMLPLLQGQVAKYLSYDELSMLVSAQQHLQTMRSMTEAVEASWRKRRGIKP